MEANEKVVYQFGRQEKTEKQRQEETERQRDEYKQKLLVDLGVIQTKPQGHLNDQSRIILENVYNYFIFEKAAKMSLISPQKVFKRLEIATGVPEWTLHRTIATKIKPARKKRNAPKTNILPTEREMIRDKIHEFYRENRPITLRKLQAELRQTAALVFSVTSLWRILIKLGFRYKSRRSRLFVYQRPEIMKRRNDYIVKIRKYRSENRKIFYQDETWLNAGHIPAKAWVDTNVEENPYDALNPNFNLTLGYTDPVGKGKRLIISHIGSEDGFLEQGADIFESKKNGDYHEEMNSERYEHHMKENVFPNLPKNSILVLDNAPYHSRIMEKIPTSSSKKNEILQWLEKQKVAYDANQTKKELLSIVQSRRSDRPKIYYPDEMAKAFGIEILRLPPYHCELNPIELIWRQIKSNVARRNSTFKLADVKKLLIEEMVKIDENAWKKAIEHVKKIKAKYGERIFDLINIKPLIIELDSSEDESNLSEEYSSSEDSYDEEF